MPFDMSKMGGNVKDKCMNLLGSIFSNSIYTSIIIVLVILLITYIYFKKKMPFLDILKPFLLIVVAVTAIIVLHDSCIYKISTTSKNDTEIMDFVGGMGKTDQAPEIEEYSSLDLLTEQIDDLRAKLS